MSVKFDALLMAAVASILLSALAPARRAEAAEPSELQQLRSVYAEQAAKITAKRDSDLDQVRKDHLTALEDLEKRYQASGDLKSLLAARTERTRFAADPQPDAVQVVESPEGLATLQKQFVTRCQEVRDTCSQSVGELTQHYKRRLILLQQELTRKGQIEEAMVVMNEAEGVETAPDARPPVLSPAGTPPAGGETAIDTGALSQYFRGKVVRWNSMSHEVTVKYDFEKKDQLADWEGATYDELRSRMVADKTPVWFRAPFASVSQIEYDGYCYSGTGPIRVMLGKDMFADLEPGADGKAILHQGNPSYPVITSHGGAQTYLRYSATLTLKSGEVTWAIGVRSFPTEKFPKPIRPPVKVGFGHEAGTSMFDNVTITGIIGPDIVRALKPPSP